MTHDRMQTNQFPLTQEFLAIMLGVQRPGVTLVAGALQRAGLIRYTRGKVTILDHAGLIKRSCECYAVSKREFDRLLGTMATRPAGGSVIEVDVFHGRKRVSQRLRKNYDSAFN